MTETSVVITGSVAFDYLMRFPGRFAEYFLPGRLDRISVSFLVDDMQRVRGGCAPNIAYSMALLGERPRIVAAAGSDAREYRQWLAEQGVDVSAWRIFDDVFTASFFCSTDQDQNQIASFYTGAMARASRLSLLDLCPETISCVIISPNDPAAMARYADECRQAKIRFFYDPSQQVTRLSGEELRHGIRGAYALICNDYEFDVIMRKSGMAENEILEQVHALIVTRGDQGSRIRTAEETIEIKAAGLRTTGLDPTGVGDAYRGALLTGIRRGWPWRFSGQVASVAAAYCLEATGPQPPRYESADFLSRYRENYGDDPGLAAVFSPARA